MRLTLHQQLVLGLQRLGFAGLPSVSRRKKFLDHRYEGVVRRYVYLGRVDSVRRGFNFADSVSDDVLKIRALEAGGRADVLAK